MKTKIKPKYVIAGVLILAVLFIFSSIVLNYSIKPNETYRVNKDNLIEDGSFENFNKTVADCCSFESKIAYISASRSLNKIEGDYSLNLTSSNRCACVYFPIKNFSNTNNYLLSFYYMGDNPRFCNWVDGDRKCLPDTRFEQTKEWQEYTTALVFTNNSKDALIHFYADSDGTKTVTNFYDGLKVHKLIPIKNTREYQYNQDEEYIIKTKTDNNIKGDMISEIDAKTGEAYFITKGEPKVTIKFPWSEVMIVIIMILVVVRLVFKKENDKIVC